MQSYYRLAFAPLPPPPLPPAAGRQVIFWRFAKILPSQSLFCIFQSHSKNAPSEVCALKLQGGSDVITKTALKRINWAAYKINQASDKIGVFVSIVSTKIPYKGAGKEYIGKSPTWDVYYCHAA